MHKAGTGEIACASLDTPGTFLFCQHDDILVKGAKKSAKVKVDWSFLYRNGNELQEYQEELYLKVDKKETSLTVLALDAKKNVNITAGENSNKTTSDSHNSDAGFGVSFSTAGLTGVELHSNKQNDAVKENTTTYKASTVTAKDTLDLHSGEDTNILGSKASGDKVKVKAEGNLNLESLQDKDTYEEKSDSSGFGISSNIKHPEAGKTGGNVLDAPNYSGSVSKGNIDSDYNSVTKQAEIHAGQGGFAIEVGKNTDLKGAVISSDATPDKNKISTGTLTYSDIENKADYSADNSGISFETATTNKTKKVNGEETVVREKGITESLDMGMPVKGSASSITKSAIAEGTIQVREGNTDFSNLSRDTKGAINALGKIFDKEKVQEKQELTKIFGQEAYKAIGDLSSREYLKALSDAAKADAAADKKAYNEAMARAESWKDGGTKKTLLHAVAGGIMSSLGGGSFTSGATAAGVNEAVQNELAKIKDPGLHQLVSAVIGAAASKLVGGYAQAGASAAANGTKYNFLAHPEQLKFAVLLEKALANKDEDEIINIITYYTAKSSYNIGDATLDDLLAMRQKEVIDGKLYEQLVHLINVKSNGSLNYTLNELSTTVYGPKAAFRANAYKAILDGDSSYDPFITPPEVELQLQQEHYDSLVANDAAAKEAERAASPGDYAYKHENAQIVGTYPDGTPAVHLEDGDYPVYSLPKQEIVESGEANYPAYTGFSQEYQDAIYAVKEADTPADKLKAFGKVLWIKGKEGVASYRDLNYKLALELGMGEDLANIAADINTSEIVITSASGVIGAGGVAASGIGAARSGMNNLRVLKDTTIKGYTVSMDLERGGSGLINIHLKVDKVKYYFNENAGAFLDEVGNRLPNSLRGNQKIEDALTKAIERMNSGW